MSIITRMAELVEYKDVSLVYEVYRWGDREPEKSISVVKRVIKRKGFLNRRIALEAPNYYLVVYDSTFGLADYNLTI